MTPLYQIPLPDKYTALERGELKKRIGELKQSLGSNLCILGHHYQSDDVIEFADFTGDSLKLSQTASRQKARYIVFCGVHFMAESADILSDPQQIVILPNLQAGCAMADMADESGVQSALDELAELTDQRIVPVTYVNSIAAVKAMTGRAGGSCCTSSNARNVFDWALRPAGSGGAGGRKILAIPDQHLGMNTAIAMGYKAEDCVLYNSHLPNGGLTSKQVEVATFILFDGYCYVHQLFKPEHVESVRRRHEGIRVIVHPECTRQVVALSDAVGSTEQIVRKVDSSPAGSKWAIGTESNMVNRLARRHKDKFIRMLSNVPSLCIMMGRIDLPHLLWVLDNLSGGEIVNRVSVAPDQARDAKTALERMIAIQPSVSAVTVRR